MHATDISNPRMLRTSQFPSAEDECPVVLLSSASRFSSKSVVFAVEVLSSSSSIDSSKSKIFESFKSSSLAVSAPSTASACFQNNDRGEAAASYK